MNRSLRIAVADDEADMRDYFCRILPRLGHRVVVTAKTGSELLASCRLTRPDLVITDVQMPDMSGLEAARLLYEELALPVLLVSAHTDPELLERAETDQGVCYLGKPIRQADLEPAIARTVNRFAQRDSTKKR